MKSIIIDSYQRYNKYFAFLVSNYYLKNYLDFTTDNNDFLQNFYLLKLKLFSYMKYSISF